MAQKVIARWESQRGKDWVEVYEQTFTCCPEPGYGYHTRNGGGWMGSNVSRDDAVEKIRQRVERGDFCSQKSTMRKVVCDGV
jgi:hypothetical protein